MRHIVSFSGGIGSWYAARRVVATHGLNTVTLLFTDTLVEDLDLYRFLLEAAADVLQVPVPMRLVEIARATPGPSQEQMPARKAVLANLRARANTYFGGRLAWIAEGRSIWDLFLDEGFLGNTRVDLCSRVLKRETADRWLTQNCDPADTVVHVGIDWTEAHRFHGTPSRQGLRARKAAQGWAYEAPLCEEPLVSKQEMFMTLSKAGIQRPRLYDIGAAHNNCGGGCIKQGQGGFALLLQRLPETYGQWETEEERIRCHLGKNVAILRDRRGGRTRGMTLKEFRARVTNGDYDKNEFGGCGCFIDAPEEDP